MGDLKRPWDRGNFRPWIARQTSVWTQEGSKVKERETEQCRGKQHRLWWKQRWLL